MCAATSGSRKSRREGGGGSSAAAIRWSVGLGLVLAVLGLAAWWLGWLNRPTDPRVVEIRQMRDDMAQRFQASGGPTTLADAMALAASMQQIRERIDALPEHLRPQAERGGGDAIRQTMRARIDAYFALPPEKRLAELDRRIDQEELMNKAFEAARTVANAMGGGGGGPGGGTSGGTSGRGPFPRSGTEEDRNRWRKSMIDRTSPAERARYVEYRRAMEKRGLPPSPWGR